MNNIALIISGNLTGFQNFYASPNANEIYKEAKFDFDYRNFLTFLSNDDKAYAISFAPSVISVSLVTRILDSFRRPGVLVVSILLPRNKKVESAMNAQNNKALYQLLNAVYDTFREKNFVNGMVNQNAAVLMQDYYTDILSNFVLVPDGRQRPINARIDVSSPNKRLGYVKSTEDNVPLYLSSLCRKSYESYHHVFIAENAPQNIDEEPVEVVFYSVKVVNTGLVLQNVKLSDKIYNLLPEEGEIDIDKNFTYQQVVNGEAGRNISASFVGETIEITYRFGKETREIRFTFRDGSGSIIPFASVSPRVVFSNGEVVNINNEVWPFEGKEIYERKTIESGNSNFTIKRESTNLDIKRLKNGSECLIHVEQSSPININFPAPYNKPKRITFRRKNGEPKVFNVESYLNEVLPGRLEEYTYVIESNYYERATGKLPPLGVQFTIDLHSKVERPNGTTTRTSSTNHGADITPQKTGTSVRGVNNGGTLKLEGDNNANKKQENHRKKKNTRVVLAGVVSAFLLAIVVTCVFFGEDIQQLFKGTNKTPEIESYNDSIDRDIIITFIDADGDFVKGDNISIDVFTRIVNTYVSQQEYVEKIDSTKTGIFNWTYHIKGPASDIKELAFVCSVGNAIINEETIVKAEQLLPDSSSIDEGVKIKLNVKTSEIRLCTELPEICKNRNHKVTKKEYDKLKERIDALKERFKDVPKPNFASPLIEMFKSITTEDEKEQQKRVPAKLAPSTPRSSTTQGGLDAQLPPDIKGAISTGSNIAQKRVETYKGEQQQALLDYKWLWSNKYKKKIPNDVKNKLAACKTFRDLQTEARNN